MDIAAELAYRQQVFDALAAVVADSGVVTREQLSAFPVAGAPRRLIDQSRGIWNPRDLAATLAVVSSPDGPYADAEVEGGFFRYDYRAGSSGGDNTKLRAAYELALPIVLLRKIGNGVYVPIFPVYVVGDDVAARRFLLAVDESLRGSPTPASTRSPSAAMPNALRVIGCTKPSSGGGCCGRMPPSAPLRLAARPAARRRPHRR